MTVEEFYDQIGGSYAEAASRLLTPERIARFAKRYPQDGTYAQLAESMEAGDVQAAFSAAHTLKGVAGNLSFAKMAAAASELTEALRTGNFELAKELFPPVAAEQEKLVAGISAL